MVLVWIANCRHRSRRLHTGYGQVRLTLPESQWLKSLLEAENIDVIWAGDPSAMASGSAEVFALADVSVRTRWDDGGGRSRIHM